MKTSFIKLLVVFLFFALSSNAKSYLTISLGKRNSVDVTVAGTGLFASVNYNRIVYVSKSYFVNTSVGYGVVPSFLGSAFPHQVSINFGSQRDFLEIGVGGTYLYGSSNASGFTSGVYSYNFNPTIGYRRHLRNNKYVFKFYVMSLMHISGEYFIEDYPVIPYAGLSFGYRF